MREKFLLLIFITGLIGLIGCEPREGEIALSLVEYQDTVSLPDIDLDPSNGWLCEDSTLVKDSVYVKLRVILRNRGEGYLYEVKWNDRADNDSVIYSDRGLFYPEIYLEEDEERELQIYLPVNNFIAYTADSITGDTIDFCGRVKCILWAIGATPYEYITSDTVQFYINFTLD